MVEPNYYSGIEIRPGTNPLIVRNKIHDSKSAGINIITFIIFIHIIFVTFNTFRMIINKSVGIFVFHNSTAASPNHTQGTIMRNEIYQNLLAGIDISHGNVFFIIYY